MFGMKTREQRQALELQRLREKRLKWEGISNLERMRKAEKERIHKAKMDSDRFGIRHFEENLGKKAKEKIGWY